MTKKNKKMKGIKIQAPCPKHGKTTFVVYKAKEIRRCLKCKSESAALWRKNAEKAKVTKRSVTRKAKDGRKKVRAAKPTKHPSKAGAVA